MDDLFLFFPQWQGSGTSPDLFSAALNLRDHLVSFPFRTVPVSTTPASPREGGILGRQDLQRQLFAAQNVLDQAKPSRVFTLGGDCGVELAPISWLNERYEGELAVVWLDAHGDLNAPESSPSGHFHGMPLRFLLGGGDPAWCPQPLSASQVILAGVRELDEPEAAFIQATALPLLTVADLEADPACVARHVLRLGFRHVYVHMDLDVLEPSEFPPLKCPTPGGIRLRTLLSVIEHLKAQCHPVGFSVLEFTMVAEDRDLTGIRSIIKAAIGDWQS